MILKDVAFKDLEKFVDDSSGEFEYVIIDFRMSKDKTKVMNYLAPIHWSEPVYREDISKIFYYFLGIVVYDKEKFTKNQTDIFPIVKKVLTRRLSQENSKKVIKYLQYLSFNDYESFKKNSDSEFIPILSDALHTVKTINALEDSLSKYDINFLTNNQKVSIVKKSDDYSSEIYDWATVDEQEEYINELFDAKKLQASVYHEAIKNIRKVLKKFNLTEILDSFFFEYIDGEQYLQLTRNFITDEIKEKMFKVICEDISNDISMPIHKNSEFYYTEIIREIKFVNLYELEDEYVSGYRRNFHAINRLYEKMSKDNLGTVKVYPHGSYANNMLNEAMHIDMDIRDRVSDEIEEGRMRKEVHYQYLVDEEEIRAEIEDEYLDVYDCASEEIIMSLDSDEYKFLTKRDKERLKTRKKKALQKRAKDRKFTHEKRNERDKKQRENNRDDTNTHCITIKNKASD